MAIEEDTRRDVQEAPKEARADSGVDGIARDSQEKPDSQRAKEREQEEMRKAGLSRSSESLPKVELFLNMVRNSGGKIWNVLTGLGKESPIRTSNGEVIRADKTDLELPKSIADMLVDGGKRAHVSEDSPTTELP